MASASGRPWWGRRLRANEVKVSLSWRCDSAAIVSKTMDDLPDPETPVKTVIRFLGILNETFLRLFSRAPVISMWLMPSTLATV